MCTPSVLAIPAYCFITSSRCSSSTLFLFKRHVTAPGKGKVVPFLNGSQLHEDTQRLTERERAYAPLLTQFGPVCWVVSFMPWSLHMWQWLKCPQYPCDRSLCGYHRWYGRFGEEKISPTSVPNWTPFPHRSARSLFAAVSSEWQRINSNSSVTYFLSFLPVSRPHPIFSVDVYSLVITACFQECW